MKINIKVKPRSGKQEVEKISENEYRAYLKSPAENNEANIELLKILKRHFKKDVRIARGFKNKIKVVEIKSFDEKWK